MHRHRRVPLRAVAGDSDGGHLTVALLLRLRDEGLPLPTGARLQVSTVFGTMPHPPGNPDGTGPPCRR